MTSTDIGLPVNGNPRHRNRRPDLGHAAIERDPNLVAAVNEAAAFRDARTRARSTVAVPDRMSGFLTGGSFLATLGIWLAVSPPASLPLGLLGILIVAHIAAASIEFEIGPGCALPTTPVLYLSLFLLPPQLVPIVALAGLLGAAYLSRLRDPNRRERFLVLTGSAWHAMGPAFVFAALGVHEPGPAAIGACGLALAAQFACDAAASWVRNCYGLGVSTLELAGALRFTFLADALLAPLGISAAIAAPGSPLALLVVVGPISLLAVLRHDREQQIDRAVVLSEAFTQSADRARRDVLTGLRNRLAWEEAIAVHGVRQSPVGVVLADVDGLKATNDALGHDAGDRLLVAVARIIADATPSDPGAMAARLGGDEFGILLPGGLSPKAGRVADNLRRSLVAAERTGGEPRVSASVGHGVARSGADLPAAFIAADRGVYEDKAARSIGRR
jgi:diguanylate cyclase (GGDEF)-like protein